MPTSKLSGLGALLIVIIMTSCSHSYISTIWKNDHAFPGKYNKILIACIVNNQDTVLRTAIENNFKETLLSMGYYAVTSFEEFGPSGLKEFGQDDTYIRLCNRGIDAVMTIALIDKKNEPGPEPKSSYTEPVKYYYDRIWHYKDRQDKLITGTTDTTIKYFWEMILFDLSTLQPHYITQTRTTEGNISESMQKEFWKPMIRRLRKDRFLKSRAPIVSGPKAF